MVGGRTVAVIGTGITSTTRPRIGSCRTASPPTAWCSRSSGRTADQAHLPNAQRRHVRLRSATIVVEAGEHSGARIQARQAVAHGRPVILTDLVVKANKWSVNLISRPGVHVASSTAGLGCSVVWCGWVTLVSWTPRRRRCTRGRRGMAPGTTSGRRPEVLE
jgi:hypothetical protein